MTLLDAWLPEYQFSERHSLAVKASDATLWDAAKRVASEEVGPVVWLMAIRTGGMGRTFAKGTPVLDVAVRSNFLLLAESPPCEIVVGRVGQFWKLDGGPRPDVRTAAGFAAFQEPGFLRAALNFEIGGGLITTETRIQALDDSARRKFALYWTLIRPASGWIRMAWLRAIRKRAER